MLEPKWRAADGLMHLRYDTPHHILAAETYPVLAPNGSEIVICAHDEGLLILWRGGRPLQAGTRPPPGLSQRSTTNVVVIDDSDDDVNAGTATAPPPPNFAAEPDEVDPRRPYLPIVQHLDLPLPAASLALTVPRLPCAAERHTLQPALLRDRLVVAVACADAVVRLLTLPLAPPAPRQDPKRAAVDRGAWGEQLCEITAAEGGHRGLTRGLAVGFARRDVFSEAEGDEAADEQGDVEMGEGADEDATTDGAATDIIIASHSADQGGMLAVHRVPLPANDDDGQASASLPRLLLYRRQRLAGPASGIDLHTPPKSAPRILITPLAGPVRVFACATAHHLAGAFTLALSAELLPCTTPQPQHRRVLAARWVLDGRAVVALTADGEWGLWDVTPAEAPAPALSGAYPTPFIFAGPVGTPRPGRPGSATGPTATVHPKSTSGRPTSGSALAPMTPGARRMRQRELFHRGAEPNMPTSAESAAAPAAAVRGGIAAHTLTPGTSAAPPDELLLLRHGRRAVMLTNLRAHWEARTRPRSADGAGARGIGVRAVETPSWEADLKGDTAVAVAALPRQLIAREATASGLRPAPAPELLVVGERCVAILAHPVDAAQDAQPRSRARVEAPAPSDAEATQTLDAVPYEAEAVDDGGDWRVSARAEMQQRFGLRPGQLSLDQVEGVLDEMAAMNWKMKQEERGARMRTHLRVEDGLLAERLEPESPSVRVKKQRGEGRA